MDGFGVQDQSEIRAATGQNPKEHRCRASPGSQQYRLKDGRLFGSLSIKSISGGVADRLFAKLKEWLPGGTRVRTALLSMQYCRRAWNVAWREKPGYVPHENPFNKMGIEYKATPTCPVSHAEFLRFVKAADEAGE